MAITCKIIIMNKYLNKNNKGFTLAELLIVVAIIAVLVAISIPIFATQLDKAKIAVDQSNVRTAKAAAIAEYLTSNNTSETQTYYYDAQKGYVVTSSDGVIGYGKYTKNDKENIIGATGTPNNNGKANFLTIKVSSEGIQSISWGGGFALWSSMSGKTINSSQYYTHTTEREQSFYNLRASVSNEERKASDIEILSSLADYFDGMSASEAEKILGSLRYNQAKGNSGSMIFQYGQDGGGSIRISNIDTDNMYYLKDLGYDPKIYVTHSAGWNESDNYITDGHNYTNQYLFTSDEMLGNSYKSNTFHNINIKFNIENGKVTNTQVWVNGLKDKGFTSN